MLGHLGADRDPIESQTADILAAVCLDCTKEPCGVHGVDQFAVNLQRRLAAAEHDPRLVSRVVPCLRLADERAGLVHDLGGAEFAARGELGVAVEAAR